VVPNPVEPPPRPDPLPARDPKRFVVVSRLEGQKRLEHVVRAFALVLKQEPDARLDIYGEGNQRALLEKEVAALGIQDQVILRGHDVRARDALWTASGFLMSSRFEGYPLATLESMSHGCPVICYDVKYGLREQVSHGVNGFLVEPDDLQAMADHVVALIRDPQRVASMSQAALATAAQHDEASFIDTWGAVLTSVVDRKAQRTSQVKATLKVTRLGAVRPGLLSGELVRATHLPGRLSRSASSSAAFRNPRPIEFAGQLTVTGSSRKSTLDDVAVTLDAICDATAQIVPIPVRVRRSADRFAVSARFDPATAFGALEPTARALRLRLRVVWQNSSWETTLARPKHQGANYEVSFSDRGELTLLRGASAPR
jgi:poly(glycerol-phosphate) alpha-glucosyltransferase